MQDNRIRVDTAGAGEGALSVTIRAAGQEVGHTIQDLANGQFDILFYPTMAIPHKFDVKYNGLPITSGPGKALSNSECMSGIFRIPHNFSGFYFLASKFCSVLDS